MKAAAVENLKRVWGSGGSSSSKAIRRYGSWLRLFGIIVHAITFSGRLSKDSAQILAGSIG